MRKLGVLESSAITNIRGFYLLFMTPGIDFLTRSHIALANGVSVQYNVPNNILNSSSISLHKKIH